MQVARFQQEAAGLARARAEKESELRKLRQENDKYVEDLEEREKKFQVGIGLSYFQFFYILESFLSSQFTMFDRKLEDDESFAFRNSRTGN